MGQVALRVAAARLCAPEAAAGAAGAACGSAGAACAAPPAPLAPLAAVSAALSAAATLTHQAELLDRLLASAGMKFFADNFMMSRVN